MTDLDVDVDFLASLNVSLGGIQAGIKKLNGHNDLEDARALANLPRQIPLYQESINATNTDFLDLGGPQAGRQWEVRLLIAISATVAGFVAMATTPVTWYVGQKIAGNAPGILPMAMVRWQFSSIPNFKDLSGDQLKVLPNEHLMVGLTGIPAAPTQIICMATVNDLPLFAGRTVVSG